MILKSYNNIRSEIGILRTAILIVIIELILMSVKLNGKHDDKKD